MKVNSLKVSSIICNAFISTISRAEHYEVKSVRVSLKLNLTLTAVLKDNRNTILTYI